MSRIVKLKLIDVDIDKENVRHVLEKLDNQLQP